VINNRRLTAGEVRPRKPFIKKNPNKKKKQKQKQAKTREV
jgi:hypothetical protein